MGNSTLLYNTKGQIDAGEYSGWIASAQIDAGGGFVNNLGYDIDFGTREIDKAQISVTLNDVNRTYGIKSLLMVRIMVIHMRLLMVHLLMRWKESLMTGSHLVRKQMVQ